MKLSPGSKPLIRGRLRSLCMTTGFSLLYPSTGEGWTKNKELFSQKNMKQEEKLLLRTNLLLLLDLVKPQPLINLACNLLVGNWVPVMERWERESIKIKVSFAVQNARKQNNKANCFKYFPICCKHLAVCLAHCCPTRNSGKIWICDVSPGLSSTEGKTPFLCLNKEARKHSEPHSTLQSCSSLHSTTNFYSTAPHLTGVPENGTSLWWCFLQPSSLKAWEANHTPTCFAQVDVVKGKEMLKDSWDKTQEYIYPP